METGRARRERIDGGERRERRNKRISDREKERRKKGKRRRDVDGYIKKREGGGKVGRKERVKGRMKE